MPQYTIHHILLAIINKIYMIQRLPLSRQNECFLWIQYLTYPRSVNECSILTSKVFNKIFIAFLVVINFSMFLQNTSQSLQYITHSNNADIFLHCWTHSFKRYIAVMLAAVGLNLTLLKFSSNAIYLLAELCD